MVVQGTDKHFSGSNVLVKRCEIGKVKEWDNILALIRLGTYIVNELEERMREITTVKTSPKPYTTMSPGNFGNPTNTRSA